MQTNDIDILARTIYGEARGEYGGIGRIASLIAVGNVVMNRVKARGRYGRTIQEVCQKPWQFSCWNEGDPNRSVIIRDVIDDPIYALCREVAINVSREQWPDLTKGSDHYHASTIPVLPRWAATIKPSVCLGKHVFYQLSRGE